MRLLKAKNQMKAIKGLYRFTFFYVPYFFLKRDGAGNEVLVFIKCVLLFLANIVSIVIIFFLISDVKLLIPLNYLTRGSTKFLALLILVPFAAFYLVNKKRYLSIFSEFELFELKIKTQLDRYVTMYIWTSIGILIFVVTIKAITVFML